MLRTQPFITGMAKVTPSLISEATSSTELELFSLEKRRGRRNLILVYNYMMGSNEEGGVRLFSMMPTDRTRGNGHKVKHMKFHVNTTLFYCEGSQTLAQVAQRHCGVLIRGDTQNLTGHSSGLNLL
ncbi:hypothetical protein QYF61_005430 [Mycteria americana]|uniref:Uncharacterized protein n=1 Tax=Mycteria americana TaxID=33587 RepID=A0AAN7MXZ3_MYCAM|nr:hypothetical protein QYF61_005430 [Mycteria americana]